MYEHARSLRASHWGAIAMQVAIMAFLLRVLWLLMLNMGMALTVLGPVPTICALSVLGMTLFLSVECIRSILDPRCVPPQGDGEQETTPNSSPEVRHLTGGAYRRTRSPIPPVETTRPTTALKEEERHDAEAK